ncbi:MAG: hybrid sensor histidine kinase/response regulator [Thiotrichaceae bacterium]|nr:hybrid sensor histidine kinase/response regulator [Thiotrichaceae bacterium]
MTIEQEHISTLLLVDDVPTNLKVLFGYLKSCNFKVRIARDGEDALNQVSLAKPDLILLDVMMPKLDGFETCRRLKANDETKDIPVIFMTALTETVDKVKGFDAGAVDYVTKPIQQEEVLARINSHLMLRQLQKTLEVKNGELQQQNQELESFAHTVAHDLKNPINAIINYTEMLKEDFGLEGEVVELLGKVDQAGHKMTDIIGSLLLLASSRKQAVDMKVINMADVIHQVEQRLAHMSDEFGATLKLPDTWHQAVGYAPWIEEVWTNYFTNALKYGGRPPLVELGSTELDDGHVKFWVRDNGDGLDQEEQSHLFVPFTRISQVRVEGHGLGLSIVQRIVERCDGRVGVKSEKGSGSVFYFTLPAKSAE